MGKITVTLRVGNASWGRHMDSKAAASMADKIKPLANALALAQYQSGRSIDSIVDGEIGPIVNSANRERG